MVATLQDDSRHDEMREECRRYAKKHPDVWVMFEEFTLDRIARGFKHYGVGAIFERIRWERGIATPEGGNTFKIGNNCRAFYARAFHKRHPQYDGFFRTRIQTSKYEPATHKAELGPRDWE